MAAGKQKSPAQLARLLAWYAAERRDLPWRSTRDPYAIWISETMLQQTRVETVLPYYERFLAQLPTVESLAEASEDQVLTLWSGLGYYRRARMLHAAARRVVSEHAARLPEGLERAAVPGGRGRATRRARSPASRSASERRSSTATWRGSLPASSPSARTSRRLPAAPACGRSRSASSRRCPETRATGTRR